MPEPLTIYELLTSPEFFTASPEARALVFDRAAASDPDFQRHSPEAQKIFRDKWLSASAPLQPMPRPGEQTQALIETGAPVVGGLAGSVPGMVAKSPTLMATGAALGAAAGQTIAELTRPLLTGQRPAGAVESATRIAETGAFGAVGEAGGHVLGRIADPVIRKVLAPFAGKVRPIMLELQAMLARAGQPTQLTPATMTESRFLDILENITESSFLGGGRLKAAKRTLSESLPALTDQLITDLGSRLSPTQLTEFFVNSRATALAMFRGVRSMLYDRVDQLGKNVPVDTTPIVDFVHRARTKQDRPVLDALAAAGVDVEELLMRSRPGTRQPFAETGFLMADEAASRLKAIARRIYRDPAAEATGRVAGKLAGMIDEQIDSAGKQLAPDALAALKEARVFTREGMARLEPELIRTFARRIEREPAKFMTTLLRPNTADTWKALGRVLPDMDRVQEAAVTELVRRSSNAETGVMSGQRLLTAIKGLGDETAHLALKSPTRLRRFAEVMSAAERQAPEGAGRIFIQLKQAGALTEATGAALTFSGFTKTGITILAAPAILGRLLTNPIATRWLTLGFQAGPGTPAFFRYMSQALATTQRPEEARRPVRIPPIRQEAVR